MKVGVCEHFDSMHLLPGHPKCGVPHGHTYKVEVAVEGPVQNGMVIDFDILKRELRAILKELDHTDLNRLIPFPSCENLCTLILERLRGAIRQERVIVRVWEGEGKWAEASG